MLRKLHRYVGMVLAPFFVITGVGGGLLLWRNRLRASDIDVRGITKLHNYEITGTYLGVVVAAGLVFMAFTGAMLFLQMFLRKHKARQKKD